MKRVWAIAFFFFAAGLFVGLFIDREFTKVMTSIVCIIVSYCLFLH